MDLKTTVRFFSEYAHWQQIRLICGQQNFSEACVK